MATDKKELKPALKKDVQKKDKAKPASHGKRRRVSLKGVGQFFKDVVSEMKKVTWASRKEFISYSIAVIVFVTACGLIIFGMDSVLQMLPAYISHLNQ